ncbi:hypothetical protein U91I_03845 [alpha proteobacterium U9-1i]|nr:hypothetical protein U91I_03845 [alpha proteobacterium U9-1i]
MLRTLILATATIAFATPALADPDPQEVPYEVVRYGDLDLDYQADANVMVRRIARASDNVCGDDSSVVSLQERARANRCERVAERQAVADVGHPNVSARYYGRRPVVTVDDEPAYDPYYDSKK